MPISPKTATAAPFVTVGPVAVVRRLPAILLLVALLAGALPPAAVAQTAPEEPPAGDVIVELEPGTDPAAAAAELGVSPTFVYDDVITGFAADVSPAKARTLQRSAKVAKISADAPVRKAAQALPTGVNRIDADRNAQAAIDGVGGGVNADVAVLDTGIVNHRDLTIAGGKSCIRGESVRDGDGHGTHVAGTIAARDNATGIVGVAPGARLWAVKVLGDDGVGSVSTVICGLEWVAERKVIDVVNMSLEGSLPSRDNGRGCDSSPYHRAICKVVRGRVPVVVAAGNGGTSAAGVAPATYDETIAVSAFADFNGQPGGRARATCERGRDDAFARFSNYGPDVDIAAPGVCIRSTSNSGGLRSLTGTSMAAPHVAGALALYKAANPGSTAAQARAWLLSDAASRPQDSPVGVTGDPDGVRERVLYLGPAEPVDGPDAPVETPTPLADATDPESDPGTGGDPEGETVAPSSTSPGEADRRAADNADRSSAEGAAAPTAAPGSRAGQRDRDRDRDQPGVPRRAERIGRR